MKERHAHALDLAQGPRVHSSSDAGSATHPAPAHTLPHLMNSSGWSLSTLLSVRDMNLRTHTQRGRGTLSEAW